MVSHVMSLLAAFPVNSKTEREKCQQIKKEKQFGRDSVTGLVEK